MASSDEINTIWSDGSEDELVRELFDDESPLFLPPNIIESQPTHSQEPLRNLFLSTLYSGPTIDDIASALSMNYQNTNSFIGNDSQSKISVTEKGLSKMENKYTLKIKSCGNAMADDGYKWRKYGQKSIKNSPNPRSYYRCTNPRCSAKKQVEKSTEDPDTLIITYEGLHLHFAYSHFLLTGPSDISTTHHVAKRPKTHQSLAAQDQVTQQVGPTSKIDSQPQPLGGVSASLTETPPQGLLEDVVPLLIRNPSSDPCFSSYPSSPLLSTSSSSLSWSPHSSSFDVGILSTIR